MLSCKAGKSEAGDPVRPIPRGSRPGPSSRMGCVSGHVEFKVMGRPNQRYYRPLPQAMKLWLIRTCGLLETMTVSNAVS